MRAMIRPAIVAAVLGVTIASAQDMPPVGVATGATRLANAQVAATLKLEDPRDFENATRGLLARIPEAIIRADDGRIVWNAGSYDFLNGPAPETVNPSLWRHSQLDRIHGLFELRPGLYQLRGYDVSVMTLILGHSGWIVVDPLLSAETARAALALADLHLGQRPVRAVLFTHSHADMDRNFKRRFLLRGRRADAWTAGELGAVWGGCVVIEWQRGWLREQQSGHRRVNCAASGVVAQGEGTRAAGMTRRRGVGGQFRV